MAKRPAVLSVKREAATSHLTLADAVSQVAESAALQAATEAVHREGRVTLEGLWLGALAPTLAAWLVRERRPLLVILPQVADAEAVAAEMGELIAQSVDVFPPGSEETELESLAHQETAQRLHVLSRLYKFNSERKQGSGDPESIPILTTTLPALLHSVPCPDSLEGDKRVLASGKRIDLIALRKWLLQSGYHSTSSVQLPGEFAVRGGILDIYPPDEPLPVRIELFDDEIESLRTFDVVSQRSIEQRDQLQLLAVQGSVAQDGSLLDYLSDDTLVVVFEQRSVMAAAQMFLQRVPFPERFAAPETLWQRALKHPTVLISQLAEEGYLGELQRLPLG